MSASGRLDHRVGRSTWHYSYDANGNLVETNTPSGGTIDQACDSQNRLVHKGYSDETPSISYAYDAAGRKTQMTDGAGTTLYSYDVAGQLLGTSSSQGNFLYTYDLNGNLLSRTYPNGLRTSYGYNDSGEMITATAQGQTTYYTFSPNGNLLFTLHPNGILDTRSYDASGRLTEVTGVKSDESPFYSRSYSYDPVGNPTEVTASTQGTNLIGWPSGDDAKSWQETYSYDSRDRLTHACLNSSCSHYYSYSYDAVGNRLSQTTEQGATSYFYDAADELTSKTAGSDTTDYTYDTNGNETQAGSTHYAYNLANELIQETKAGSEVSYTYTGDGLMATRSTSSATTNYSWDTSSDVPNLAMEGARSYTYGVGLMGLVSGSDSHTYHTDSLGSVVELSDSSGNSVESYRYSPYGEANAGAGDPEADSGLGNSLRYADQYLDSETDLYDMRAREYDPDSGRFLEVDPLEATVGDPSAGVYVYVDDRPTAMTDPSGEEAMMSAAMSASTSASSATSLLSKLKEVPDLWNRPDIRWCRTHPQHAYACFVGYMSSVVDRKLATAKFPHNAKRCNAYRHCIWSSELFIRVGYKLAHRFLDLHELVSTDPIDSKIDVRNNKIGLSVALVALYESDYVPNPFSRVPFANQYIKDPIVAGARSICYSKAVHGMLVEHL